MQYVRSIGYSKIALYGHSLGSRVCLEAYDQQFVEAMILTGVVAGSVKYNWDEHFTVAQMAELKEKGTQPNENQKVFVQKSS